MVEIDPIQSTSLRKVEEQTVGTETPPSPGRSEEIGTLTSTGNGRGTNLKRFSKRFKLVETPMMKSWTISVCETLLNARIHMPASLSGTSTLWHCTAWTLSPGLVIQTNENLLAFSKVAKTLIFWNLVRTTTPLALGRLMTEVPSIS